MANAKVKDKVVPAHLIDSKEIRCPECRGNNLVLEGYLQKVYAVEYRDGVVIAEEESPDPFMHNVQIIHCRDSKCSVKTKIISQELWEAMQVASAGRGMVPC